MCALVFIPWVVMIFLITTSASVGRGGGGGGGVFPNRLSFFDYILPKHISLFGKRKETNSNSNSNSKSSSYDHYTSYNQADPVLDLDQITSTTTNTLYSDNKNKNKKLLIIKGGNIELAKAPEGITSKRPAPATAKFQLNLRFLENYFSRALTLFIADPDILRISAKFLSWLVWLSVALSFIGTLGFDTKPLLSVLVMSGITVGLAGKDVLNTTFIGLFVLLCRPFKRGYIIAISDGKNQYKGRVVSWDMRYVKIQDEDSTIHLVPLSMVYKNVVSIIKKA